MRKVYIFLANGFEDVEALAPIDILRRGGLDVKTVSITQDKVVTSAHQVPVVADVTLEEIAETTADLLVLPGGMPGAANLKDSALLGEMLRKQAQANKPIGAICAAPMVLGALGLLKDRKATCYPGFETYLEGATYTADIVTVDQNIITAKGPAAALAFGYTLLSLFATEQEVSSLRDGMIYTDLENSIRS